jgi:hypothetical protein
MTTTKTTASGNAEKEPTNEQLRLVARHGSGNFVRALATVMLMKRQGREDELRDLTNDGTEAKA